MAEVELPALMASLARGDLTAYEPFYKIAAGPVRRIVDHDLRSKGIRTDRDRLDDLVGDCLLELIRLAPGWRPDGGAKPWNWARRRLLRIAYEGLGLFADDLDDHLDLAARPICFTSVVDDEVLEAFELITELNRSGRALGRALDHVANPRDKHVWLDVLHEQGAGNSSPAVTVAQNHGLTEANVRKICQRVRDRLMRLAKAEPEYAVLVDLPAVNAA